MSDGRKYYCICDSNCKFETMTKEQILAAIAQAVETGRVGDCDTGFITKVKETNGGNYITFWVGTQNQYNAVTERVQNCVYIITDGAKGADIENAVESNTRRIDVLEKNQATSNEPVLLTHSVAFSSFIGEGAGGQNVALRVVNHHIVYYPAIKYLHYNISVYLNGTMTKGEAIFLLMDDAPQRVKDNSNTPALVRHYTDATRACAGRTTFLQYNGADLGTGFVIEATEAIDTAGEECRIVFDGGYFV